MSGIVGVFNSDRGPVDDALVRRLLDRMRSRGSDRTGVWSADGGALAVGRNNWELADGFSGDVLAVEDGDLVIAADASIYYRKDLGDKLAAKNVRVTGTTPSHLILAAYRAWGEECVKHLEGDYAFIVHDHARRRTFCARDFGGKRPLYYADLDRGLILGSTIAAILGHPDCPDTLNIPYLAEAAGLLWPSARETAYEAIALVPAGWSLSWTGKQRTRPRQDWVLPEGESAGGPPFDEAALELRDLLCRATDERLATKGVTTVWMSGGWDSTAVFGAGQQVLQGRSGPQQLRPVSISYPRGDPGREDELITAVADSWETPVHWLDIRDIPLIDRPLERAATRDEPAAHAYENWNRALARGSRGVGARVALDGNGGDQLFQVSPVFLADLFRTARWTAFAREWRALGLHGFSDVFQWALKPMLAPVLLDVATALRRGRRLHGTYERWMPSWMNQRLVESLRERQRRHVLPRNGRTCSAYETRFYLSCAHFPRIFGTVAGLALEEGVEARAPLYDRRVVEFAAGRPRWERCSAGETKRLLRHAMRGLLPDHLLAPRPFRTGVTSEYFAGGTRNALPDLLGHLGESWALADLGIVERELLTRACRDYVRSPDPNLGVALLCTLHVELWLRARAGVERAPRVGGDLELAASAVPGVMG
jgi:asparagine synthase (glutamine-hydrolysing)